MKIVEKISFRLTAYAFCCSLVLLLLGACGDLFKVDNPNFVLDEELDSPEFIQILSNSAPGALSRYYSWTVVVAGMPSDEVMAQQTEQGGSPLTDVGQIDDNLTWIDNAYNNLSAARWTATDVSKRLENLVDNPTSSIELANAYFWDGIARTTLADMFKEIPFDNGPAQTPENVYLGAIELFKKSASIANASTSPLSGVYEAASYASIARVYRSLYFERGHDNNSFVQARDYANQALAVSTDFKVEMIYDPPGTQNQIYTNFNQGSYYKMDPSFANKLDPVSGVVEPRIKHGPLLGLSNLRGEEVYHQLKYPSSSAAIPVSRWQEAELILAEYEVLLGTPANAVSHINTVRNAVGLANFASADANDIYDQLKYERSVEFWLELRRWQDMRYYNIVPHTWIPSAVAAGVNRRFPVSIREKDANPNF